MAESKPIRTRIAPSPTGAPHIGTAYSALFNYAFARRHGGRFLLRIEDTDRGRCTPESERAILEALRWMRLSWDEGPDIGGPVGPYRQSERSDIYRDHVLKLLAAGHAYPCFCTAERLAQLRSEQTAAKTNPGYDGRCESIPAGEAQQRMAAGEPYVIRMKIPAEGDCVFRDRFRGEIKISWAGVDRQVLLKSDGFPTYHLANVVDDHLMGITHVIRGEEWISSTPKHVLLYRYFGWDAPEFAHLPLLRNPDKTKLSKRKNPTSILYYRAAGYLPEALVNYLGLMAYSMPDGREIFALDELTADFDLDRISLGGPVFDLQKLANFNGQYLRRLNVVELADRVTRWKLNESVWKRILPLVQPRINTLSELVPKTAFCFADKLDYAPAALLGGGLDGPRTAQLLKIAQWEIEKTATWTPDIIKTVFTRMAEKENIELKALLMPFYVAIAGSAVALPLFESMEILGKDMVLRRLQYALESLAEQGYVLKGKDLKQLETRYESNYKQP
ncbi:MAG: glutamate--tRNA ligase [Kiritimatiellota bacterium]|nr:glutamate--tRNA ligase [Kiritimatiellota bacterium]